MFRLFDKRFNAVIEGTYRNYPDISHLKVSRIDANSNATLLDDEQYKFHLYAVYSDNLEIALTNGDFKPYETRIKNVAYSHGLLMNHRQRERHHVLEVPRMICFRDGRVYLEESLYARFHHTEEKSYLRPLVKASRKMFSNKELERLFKKSLEDQIA